MDNILGYVHHQQMLTRPKNIQKIVLDIPFVPEVMRVQEVMNIFIKNRISIACVVDEFGGLAAERLCQTDETTNMFRWIRLEKQLDKAIQSVATREDVVEQMRVAREEQARIEHNQILIGQLRAQIELHVDYKTSDKYTWQTKYER